MSDEWTSQQTSIYKPDNWVMIKIYNNGEPFYKIVGGWSGGYLDGNSWRINSGVTKVEETEDRYFFYGSSGSVYKCRKDSNMVRMNIANIVKSVEDNPGVGMVMPEHTNYMELNYEIN